MANQTAPSEDMFIKKGRMTKSPLKMSVTELKAWEDLVAEGIRSYLFSIGQPLVYQSGDRLVAEYEDGKIVNL